MPNKISFVIERESRWGSQIVYKGVISNGRKLSFYMERVLGKRNCNKILNCKRYKVTYEKRKNGIYKFDGSSLLNRNGNFFCNCLIPSTWRGSNIKRYITVLELE